MKPKHVPIRSCVVCRETSVKKDLLRVVRRSTEDGGTVVSVDITGKANGRGAYVCSNQDCIGKAVKQRRFERSLSVSSVPETLLMDLTSLAATKSLHAPVTDSLGVM